MKRYLFLSLLSIAWISGLTAATPTQEYIVFNGGITINERESAPKTGTKLSFFVRAGNYLSNVSVSIADSRGQEIVRTVTDGPWLILNLPEGDYQITASISSGETQSLKVMVTGETQEIGFMFTSVE